MANNRKKQPKAQKPKATKSTEGEKKQSTRSAVMAQDRKRRQRRKRIETGAIIAIPVIGVLLLVGLPIMNWIDERMMIRELSSGSCQFDEKSDPGASGTPDAHADQVSYELEPPSGGTHLPTAAPAGDYSSGQVPPDGQIVHAHEHGYITLWYKPDNPDIAEKAKAFYQEHSRDVLLVPRPSLPVPVAATMWKKRLLCEEFEQDKIQTFFDAYVNEGPEKIPHP